MNSEIKRIQTFRDLNAWKEGHNLILMVYEETGKFPREEQFGLTSQLRRAVVSITSNIAEGFSRSSFKEKMQFYTIATGSLRETENQLLIARDIGYLKQDIYCRLENQTITVSKIIGGLIKGTKNRSQDSKFGIQNSNP